MICYPGSRLESSLQHTNLSLYPVIECSLRGRGSVETAYSGLRVAISDIPTLFYRLACFEPSLHPCSSKTEFSAHKT